MRTLVLFVLTLAGVGLLVEDASACGKRGRRGHEACCTTAYAAPMYSSPCCGSAMPYGHASMPYGGAYAAGYNGYYQGMQPGYAYPAGYNAQMMPGSVMPAGGAAVPTPMPGRTVRE